MYFFPISLIYGIANKSTMSITKEANGSRKLASKVPKIIAIVTYQYSFCFLIIIYIISSNVDKRVPPSPILAMRCCQNKSWMNEGSPTDVQIRVSRPETHSIWKSPTWGCLATLMQNTNRLCMTCNISHIY